MRVCVCVCMCVCVNMRVCYSCRKELCSAQEEYVRVCGEKDRLEAAQAKMAEQVQCLSQLCTRISVDV